MSGEGTADLPMTPAEAKRITTKIELKLGTIADNIEGVMPLIREALDREAWRALDYASAGAYVKDRFGGTLDRIDAATRQDIVRELAAAGLSTRAIAPVVGASQSTVARDARTGEPDDSAALRPSGHSPRGDRIRDGAWRDQLTDGRGKVIGIDGKSYDGKHQRLAITYSEKQTETETKRDAVRYQADPHDFGVHVEWALSNARNRIHNARTDADAGAMAAARRDLIAAAGKFYELAQTLDAEVPEPDGELPAAEDGAS